MGIFSKIGNSLNQAFGGVDSELMQNGLLGRGMIASATPSGGTVQVGGGLVERTCTFQVQVLLDGKAPYLATVVQRVPEVYLGQLQSGGATVAVRVDPAQPERVALDLATTPPSVRMGRSTGPGSAEHVLQTGSDATVVLVSNAPLGYQDYRGYDIHGFVLTVASGAPQPYQAQVGMAVPPESLPLLFPGSKLHAKIGPTPGEVVIDFAQGAVAS